MKELSVLVILSVSLLIASCCKSNKCKCNKEWGQKVDDCTPVHFGPFPLGGAKDYLYFKPGSWWVYRNNLTGETDSIYTVYCDTTVIESEGDPRWLTLTYTTISFEQRSDSNKVLYKYYRIDQAPSTKNFKCFQTQQRVSLNKSDNGPYPVFSYPFTENPMADYLMIKLYPSLNILGKDYEEVAVFQSDRYDFTVQLPTKLPYHVTYGGVNKYYWAKGYGLVQIEGQLYKPSDSSLLWQKWELLRSHLIQ